MNQRVSKVKHPAGFEITTPLLIPSFSSKGFALDEQNRSELCGVIDFTREFIFESQLVSAYDMYYKHIPSLEGLNKTQITFVDSGGYETSNNYDLSETRKYERQKNTWNRDLFMNSVKDLGELTPISLVSYDHISEKKPIPDQINDARTLFQAVPYVISDFLIKPNEGQSTIQIDEVLSSIDELRHFNIIGVTEKELGESMAIRMDNIGKLRRKLDERGIGSPIHVFGALDPISVILYFISGAEIFDGLSWLKYSFQMGFATYINNLAVLDGSLSKKDNDFRLEIIKNNLYMLERIKVCLSEFAATSDFNLFDRLCNRSLGSLLRSSVETLK